MQTHLPPDFFVRLRRTLFVALLASGIAVPVAAAGREVPVHLPDAQTSDGDTDGDGITDDVDNCTTWPNAGQDDTDGDGFGNACDADTNQDCSVAFVDLGGFKAVFAAGSGGYDPDFDFTGLVDGEPDGYVNFLDLGRMKATFFNQGDNAGPGPSACGRGCGAGICLPEGKMAHEQKLWAALQSMQGPAPDTDADGITDDQDNCITFANEDQTDTNGDGFGNACDADTNDDCTVNFIDLGEFKEVFSSGPDGYDQEFDFSGITPGGPPDGFVAFTDLGRLKETFFNQGVKAGPGPSAFATCSL